MKHSPESLSNGTARSFGSAVLSWSIRGGELKLNTMFAEKGLERVRDGDIVVNTESTDRCGVLCLDIGNEVLEVLEKGARSLVDGKGGLESGEVVREVEKDRFS